MVLFGSILTLSLVSQLALGKKHRVDGSISAAGNSNIEDKIHAETCAEDTSGKFNNRMALPTKNYGIWDRSNAYPFPNTLKFGLRGWGSGIKWSDFEKTQGNFNYTFIDSVLNKAASAGAVAYFMVWIGPDSPQWIYTSGSPEVKVGEDADHSGWDTYPYYLDPKYNLFRNNMLKAFATFLRNHKNAASVGFVQANFGCTGDAVLYKKEPTNEHYRMTPEQETQHMKDSYKVYKSVFQEGPGRVIPILVNVDDLSDDSLWNFLFDTFMAGGFGIKGSAYVRGHHLRGERTWMENHSSKLLNSTTPSDTAFVFSRAEMDQTYNNPLAKVNQNLYIYWGLINGLQQGLGVHDVSQGALALCAPNCENYEFFNKYAPQVWPMNSTRAFIALHEGLDAFDKEKFSETKYGKANINIERVRAICADYAAYGAKVEDEKAVLIGQVYQRESQFAYNDVGYDIWKTNYGRWLEQIDADVTSQGLFRIGGNIDKTSSKYARFARGLIHKTGKNGMYFKFSDGFFFVTKPALLTMDVIFYDNQKGSFQVNYVDSAGKPHTALDQACAGDHTWKTAQFKITDLGSRKHTRNSDFSITSSTSTDIIIHMIEAERALA